MTLQTETAVINGVPQRRLLKIAVPAPLVIFDELLHDALNVLEQGDAAAAGQSRMVSW
jgi:SpoU rRNA methylase family enzyme